MCWSPPGRRPAWGKDLVGRVYWRRDNPHGSGKCWHCGKVLAYTAGERREWHIDHHPQPFKSIHNQLCCGVTDPLDESNLVPSCAACNCSHEHEAPKRWYFCGRSQCCCLVSVARYAAWACAGTTIGVCASVVVMACW